MQDIKLVRATLLCLKRFKTDASGQIALLFAFASLAILIGVGGGIDLGRAYMARQRLSQVATLTCQFSKQPSVINTANSTYSGSNGFGTYLAAVNAYAANSLASQHWTGPTPTGSNGGTYFTATAAAASASGATAPTNPVVELSANVPTTIMNVVHVTQIPVHAKVNCLTAPNTPATVNATQYLVYEGFENPCNGYCDTQPNGQTGSLSTPTTSMPANPSYTGTNGTKWYITGYCLEEDQTGVINATSPEGSHTAELDCDNGQGTAGNSSISTKAYMANGTYELRYFYNSRVDYPTYDPTYICGSTANDVSWANDTIIGPSTQQPVARTNQLNVYLDMASGTAPTHQTLTGQTLSGTNLIDVCVYSQGWIERSVKITVTTPAYYYLTFAGDGANDSYGGQLDSIRLCPSVCPGTLQENFPSIWRSANNGGVNKVLFEDLFTTPAKTIDTRTPANLAINANLSQSYGTTGNAAPPGWPNQTARGWAAAPTNQVTYVVESGTQYIELDGCAASCPSNYSSSGSRLISRPFLLDPGFYSVSYQYRSMLNYNDSAIPGVCLYSPYITTAPVGHNAVGSYASFYNGPSTGQFETQSSYVVNTTGSSNLVGVFMSHGQLVSTPVVSTTQGATTQYMNPGATAASATATVPIDAVNYFSLSGSGINNVIDVCGYVDQWNWVSRTASVQILKPGIYWLTFSTNGGTTDGFGGAVDDVKLTGLGSPHALVASPPASTTPILAADVTPGSTYNNSGAFNGFSIIADPIDPAANP